MLHRSALLFFLKASVLLPALLCGCGGPNAQVRSPEEIATLDALSAEERFFVGRWRVNMDRMLAQVKSRGKVVDAGMAIGVADTLFFDVGADHTLVWSGGKGVDVWTLTNGQISLQQGGMRKQTVSLSRCGDAACVQGQHSEPPLELQRVSVGAPIDPADVAGEWVLDADASIKASLAEFGRIAEIVEELSGKSLGDNAPTEQHARASLQSVVAQGGASLVFTPGATPSEGLVQVGSKPRGNPIPYRVYKDLVLVQAAGGGGAGKPMVVPVPITDGSLTWKVGGSAMVYRKK